MSLTTVTLTSQRTISTFILTSNGVVQTGTVVSVAAATYTGSPTTATITGPDTVLFTTTIDGSPSTGMSLITDIRTRTGNALPLRARSPSTGTIIITNIIPVTSFRSMTVAIVTASALQSQLTSSSEIVANPTDAVTTTSSQLTKPATTTSVTTPGGLFSPSASSSENESTTVQHITVQPTTAAGTSAIAISNSRASTTLMTITTAASASSSPTLTAITAMPPMNMHTMWWVPIPAILAPLVAIALLWLWQKCARKSYDEAGCFLHAVFETFGGMIFGKRWDEWKATRDENRRKKARIKSRLSPVDDRHIRNVLLSRWNDTVENYRKEGNLPEHNSPPSTASGGTWRNLNRDTMLSTIRPETVEMTNRGARAPHARTSNDMFLSPSATRRRNKGKGRADSPSLNRSSRAIPNSPKARAGKTEIASQQPYLNEGRLNALAPWPETWPESPHPGVPWEPHEDSKSLISHNQWFPREIHPAELRSLVHQDAVRDIDAGADADTKSQASFKGARGVWPIIHPQPLPPPAKTPPLAAAVVRPSTSLPEPSLGRDHPILRIPSPEPLPEEPRRSGSHRDICVPPLRIRRPSDTQWTDATAPRTDCGPSLDGNSSERFRTGAIASFLGWKTASPSLVKGAQKSSTLPTKPLQSSSKPPVRQVSASTSLPLPPHIPGTTARRTSMSEWTDVTVPATTWAPNERARSRSPPLGIDRWNSTMATRGPGPAPARRWSGQTEDIGARAAGWEGGSDSVSGTDHYRPSSPPQHHPNQHRPQPLGVPDLHTVRQSVTSAYSGYWDDDAGGKVAYDRHGRIQDVQFQGGAKVGLASEWEGSEYDGDVGRRRAGIGDGHGTERKVDLDYKGHQRDEAGTWI